MLKRKELLWILILVNILLIVFGSTYQSMFPLPGQDTGLRWSWAKIIFQLIILTGSIIIYIRYPTYLIVNKIKSELSKKPRTLHDLKKSISLCEKNLAGISKSRVERVLEKMIKKSEIEKKDKVYHLKRA